MAWEGINFAHANLYGKIIAKMLENRGFEPQKPPFSIFAFRQNSIKNGRKKQKTAKKIAKNDGKTGEK